MYDKENEALHYYPDDELLHYGRKGMKWGQHIFGKVKSGIGRAGKATGDKIKSVARKAKNDYQVKRDRRKYQKETDAFRKRPLKDLTDDELDTYIKRLNKEKEAANLKQTISSMDKKKISAGKEFMDKLWRDSAVPAITTAGKNVLTKFLEKQGMNVAGLTAAPDALANLKKAAEKAKLEFEISENSKKKRQNDDWFEKRDEDLKQRKEKREASSNNQPNGSQKTKQKNGKNDDKVYTGEVSGEGTSKRTKTENKSKKPDDYYDPIDTDFVSRDTPASHVKSTTAYELGRLYLTGGKRE